MKQLTILLALVCVLAYVGSAQAECCRASLNIRYNIGAGTCSATGGQRTGSSGCTITVCADGKPQVGTYCGRGSCNIFGCDCEGDCITGDWQQSFINNNKRYKVRLLSVSWNA